jgi:hypothetical protein
MVARKGKGGNSSRIEISIFAQAWKDTVEQFDIVISSLVAITWDLRWLGQEEDAIRPERRLKMTPSQVTKIKDGLSDAQGRSLEALALALYKYSKQHDNSASFDFYCDRLLALLKERAEDIGRNEVSSARMERFTNIASPRKGRKPCRKKETELALAEAKASSVRELVEDEMRERGLDPDHDHDRDRFLQSLKALRITFTKQDLAIALSGNRVEDVLLGRMANFLFKDRYVGILWTMDELQEIQDSYNASTAFVMQSRQGSPKSLSRR